MERRYLPSLADHNNVVGAFATKWEHWKNPRRRAGVAKTTGGINVSHPDDIDCIPDAMGLYVALYEPSPGRLYVAYVGYSKKLRKELKIRYGRWASEDRLRPRRSHYPFAAFYLSSQRDARAYEDDLIRYYCPPWNSKFHR